MKTGSVDLVDNKVEGTTELTSEDMYTDIERVASLIGQKRIENSTYVGTIRAMNDFYANLARAKAEENKPAEGLSVEK